MTDDRHRSRVSGRRTGGRGRARPGSARAGTAAGPGATDLTQVDEAAFLAAYDPEAFERPSLTVDLVLLTVEGRALRVLLLERPHHPAKGRLSLPGTFVGISESVEAAAQRLLREQFAIDVFEPITEEDVGRWEVELRHHVENADSFLCKTSNPPSIRDHVPDEKERERLRERLYARARGYAIQFANEGLLDPGYQADHRVVAALHGLAEAAIGLDELADRRGSLRVGFRDLASDFPVHVEQLVSLLLR